MFDTHAHLNFEDFDEERESLIEESFSKNLKIINVGATLKSAEKAVEISQKEKGIYAAVGVHPLHADEDFQFDKLADLADEKEVVAIGETGLDMVKPKTIERQRDIFKKHIGLAKEKRLPLILHSRKAHKETLEMIPDYEGVIHCFTGSLKEARLYIEKGYLIGVNGIIFKLNLKKVLKEIPLEKIILETDCPYLSPPGWKGKNTPLAVFEVAEKIAEIKDLSLEEVEKQTDKNAKKLFGI